MWTARRVANQGLISHNYDCLMFFSSRIMATTAKGMLENKNNKGHAREQDVGQSTWNQDYQGQD
jgi:hypothetical protein